VFAAERETFAVVHLRATGVQLAMTWGLVPWEHIVRVMLQLYAGDAPTKLGMLAGVADGDVAATVEVTLDRREPPAMRVMARIAAGGK